MLKVLCEANQAESNRYALELLAKWSDRVDDSGNRGLAHAIHRAANDKPSCWELEQLIHAIRNDDLRS